MKNTILELIAAVLFAAPVVAATTVDSFRQPETPPEPPAAIVQPAQSEPPPVPDIWEIVRNDNQAAADICAARGKR